MPRTTSDRHHRLSRLPGWLRRTLSTSLLEGVVSEVVPATAGGAVLIAWALHLGCSGLLVAALCALPALAQLLHLPASWVTARRGARRTAVRSHLAARQLYLVLAAVPWIGLPVAGQRALLVVAAASSTALSIVGHNAWLVWMTDLVHPTLRGRYFGRRGAAVTAAGALAALGAAAVLDAYTDGRPRAIALSALALLAWAAGGLSVWLLARQHPPRAHRLPPAHAGGVPPRPLAVPAARRALAYVCAWNAALGLTATAFPLQVLQVLRLRLGGLALHGAGVAVAHVASYRIWSRRLDRRGIVPVLTATAAGAALLPLLWLAPTPGRLWPLAIDALLTGVFLSGHGLALGALPMATAPAAGRPRWLASFSSAGGLSFAAGALASGAVAQRLPATLRVAGRTLGSLHAVFLAGAAARLLAALAGPCLLAPMRAQKHRVAPACARVDMT